MSRLRKRSPPAILQHQIARRSLVGYAIHRRIRVRQTEAAGRFIRLRGSTASSERGGGAGEQQKRRPIQGCRCCHCDAARVVDARPSPRLPCIRARQSRLPISMRERSRGRPGHPAYCPPSNDDRCARIPVARGRAIAPRANADGFGSEWPWRHNNALQRIADIRHLIETRKYDAGLIF